MATAFNDSIRNQIEAERVRNERAVAAMQLLASMNQTGSTRYGHDKAAQTAQAAAANEAERIRSTLLLGQETNASAERVAGLGRTSTENIAKGTAANEATRLQNILDLGKSEITSAENIEKMRGANSMAVAKWNAMLQDPRYAGNADKLDADIDQLNGFAKVAAAKANFALQSGIDGTTKWGGLAKKTLTPAEVSTLASGIWNGATGDGSAQMFYNGKAFEPIIMPKPPRRGYGLDPTPNGLPVPPMNQSLMTPPSYGVPPPLQMGAAGLPPMPTGRVAVPAIQRQPAPMAVQPSVPSNAMMAPRQLPFWAQPSIPQPYVDPNPQLEDPRVRTMRLMQDMQRLTGRP